MELTQLRGTRTEWGTTNTATFAAAASIIYRAIPRQCGQFTYLHQYRLVDSQARSHEAGVGVGMNTAKLARGTRSFIDQDIGWETFTLVHSLHCNSRVQVSLLHIDTFCHTSLCYTVWLGA